MIRRMRKIWPRPDWRLHGGAFQHLTLLGEWEVMEPREILHCEIDVRYDEEGLVEFQESVFRDDEAEELGRISGIFIH
jgi:hypothetical protein